MNTLRSSDENINPVVSLRQVTGFFNLTWIKASAGFMELDCYFSSSKVVFC